MLDLQLMYWKELFIFVRIIFLPQSNYNQKQSQTTKHCLYFICNMRDVWVAEIKDCHICKLEKYLYDDWTQLIPDRKYLDVSSKIIVLPNQHQNPCCQYIK